jgi:aryl-alcohol dehydrogenase-like predicted oxidoreductase
LHVRPFGRTGLHVSALGLGAGQIGAASLDEAAAGRLLNTALDLGITLVDTARGYGLSEERIGRHLAHRRGEFVLSTKVGYGIEGVPDWTPEAVARGIDEALARLRTDVIDIVHLHSCPLDTLRGGGVVEALVQARDAGKIRVAAYSGENEPLDWALHASAFGSVECSVNLFDQDGLSRLMPAAMHRGLGVIAKRPLGNAPWRFARRPQGDYAEAYWERQQALAYSHEPLPWDDFALRFTAFAPCVSTAIVGTSSIEHLRHNVALAALGPLPDGLVAATRARWNAVNPGWRGEL